MKKDLITAIISAIVGVLIAYFVVSGVFLKEPAAVNIKSIDNASSSSLAEPSPEVFNYRALNPTVETYVDCKNYDTTGACLDGGE